MSRCQNYDASSKKKIVPWSDLNHDVLYSVMMRLGVVEFLSFSGVCKPWRSLALSNKKNFMVSRPPMLLWISENKYCYLEDFEGRKFKTIIPELVGRKCIGLSCGYLILFGRKILDFWLVNPITRHQLHFPDFPFHSTLDKKSIFRAILVFSPSINGWVFVMLCKSSTTIWFSIAGTGAWDSVSSTSRILDLHVFMGKIYTLNCNLSWKGKHVCEMILDPVPTLVPKLNLPESQFMHPWSVFDFISSDENIYLIDYRTLCTYNIFKLDFDQWNCAPCEKTTQEYSFFNSRIKFTGAVKSEAWAASSSSVVELKFPSRGNLGKGRMYIAERWYFPHECLNINLIDK